MTRCSPISVGVPGAVLVAVLVAVLMAATAAPAVAGAPMQSLYPKARPLAGPVFVPRVPLVPVYYTARIRPRPRPTAAIAAVATRPSRATLALSAPGLRRSLRPHLRPAGLRRNPAAAVTPIPVAAVRSQPATVIANGRKGAVCRDRAIRGQQVSPIRGRLAGCRVARPVKVSSISGVVLSPAAVIDCPTAQALKTWIQKGAKPAVGRLGGGIRSLRIAASYSCRTRNSKPGAKLSEHAKGKAVDISVITLNNGLSISVLKGWRNPVQGKILRRMHKAACGPFGTVLGPDANRYHRDHFHFDTARYRSGSYCR